MKLTVDAIMALNPCLYYPRKKVEALVQRLSTDTQFEVLSSIPVEDAYWFLSRALSVLTRVRWAEACAERARGYADAAGAANYAARYDSRNAEYAAAAAAVAHYARYATSYVRRATSFSRYAADAAHYAEYAARASQYADSATEQRLAVEHGVRLMGAG